MACGRSRSLVVNWKAVDGAAHGRRKLMLRPNCNNIYICPIKICLHSGFKSSRGLRKHINSKHSWYYYFDEQPEIKREEIEMNQPLRKKVCTSKKPAFSLEDGIGKTFLLWLCTSCGGGKSRKEALQIGKRAMKFLMEALGNNEGDNELTNEFIDCCLTSVSILIKFLQTLEEDWKLSSSASLNYVKAIGDMVDFRKANGVSDNTLRCFTVIEVYIRRAKENLSKKKNIECHRNLDLETLIARGSWATIEEMEEVIPFHIKEFKLVIEKCKEEKPVTKSELVFCTRFITALLFLRVTCSRPMTYQFLTIAMIEKAKFNDGIVDQTEFKTSAQYVFDTLIITTDVMSILDLYIDYIRPRLYPKCEYLLISTNGTQYQSLTTAMTMLVNQAIGKYIHPTRYRQIVETESSERLTREEQEFVTEDQKHSSNVAKIFYKKKQSRIVAMQGKKCMDKMTQQARGTNSDLMQMFNKIDNDFDNTVIEESRKLIQDDNCKSSCSNSNSISETNFDIRPVNDTNETEIVITNVTKALNPTLQSTIDIPVDDVVIKKEVVNLITNKTGKNVKFTAEEDRCLKEGINKYGRKSWACILKDDTYNFHKTRTRDSLRVRAESVAFKRYFVNQT